MRLALFSHLRLHLAYRRFSTMSENYSVVYVTTPNEKVATDLASRLVEAKLAACANIIPGITSIYMWQGKVEKETEQLMMIKTKTDLVPQLANMVKANHPYDVPEVISVKIDQGHQPYLDWIGQVTKK